MNETQKRLAKFTLVSNRRLLLFLYNSLEGLGRRLQLGITPKNFV